MQPDKWTLVRGARQLLTLHGHSGARRFQQLTDLGLIVDGSVLVHNGVIDAVGPTRRIENMSAARYADEIDASGRVVMPAFIDPHACLLPVPAHRRETARTIHTLPASRLESQADELLKLMARHGTATIGALSGYGKDATGELKILRALHARHRKPLDIVSIVRLMNPAEGDHDAGGPSYDLLNCVARRKLARIAAVSCGEEHIPRSLAETLLKAARSLGMAIRMEISQPNVADLVEMAVTLGALSLSIPGAYRSPDIEQLSASSTMAILLPQLLAQHRTGAAGGLPVSARPLIDNGVRIAVGSGLNPEGGSTASMQTVIQTAWDVLGMTLPEAISASTINAAWALGVGGQTGSLEHGKSADLILLNASDYREIPLLAGTNLTYLMIKSGVVLFKEDFPGWPTPIS